MRSATETPVPQTSYADLLYFELSRESTHHSDEPVQSAAERVGGYAEVIRELLPEMGLNWRADAAYAMVREEAVAHGVWQQVLNLLIGSLSANASFGEQVA